MLLLLSLIGCTQGGLAVGVPWLEIPRTVTFEGGLVGSPNVLGVSLRNTGTAEALVQASATPPFEVTAEQVIVAPDAEGVIPILVIPQDYAPLTGELRVSTQHDGQTEEHPVELVLNLNTDMDGDGDPAREAGGTDCDDTDPARHGQGIETCNGIDDDCDSAVDNVDPLPQSWPDSDGDGYGDASAEPFLGCFPPETHVQDHTDCDDGSALIFPGAAEIWYDGVDQACDGGDDFDQDGDLFSVEEDCDDLALEVNPEAVEQWYDGIDQNCDGNDDDQDGDGDPGGPMGPDCDDLDTAIGPSVPEQDDGIDQDCDNYVDEGLFSRGSLLVTEVMVNPAAVSDANGRYIELYNPTDGHVELGLVTARIGVYHHPLPARFLAPGTTFVMCSDQDIAQNGGIACDGSLQWIGLVQEIELYVSSSSLVLDEINWQGWSTPTPGASWELSATQLHPDADTEADWCVADDIFGSGDRGSPGSVSQQCQ